MTISLLRLFRSSQQTIPISQKGVFSHNPSIYDLYQQSIRRYMPKYSTYIYVDKLWMIIIVLCGTTRETYHKNLILSETRKERTLLL